MCRRIALSLKRTGTNETKMSGRGRGVDATKTEATLHKECIPTFSYSANERLESEIIFIINSL